MFLHLFSKTDDGVLLWSVKECYTLWPESMSKYWKKLLPALWNVLLNATPFNGDLLGSYESPTISTISARNAIQQHEKNMQNTFAKSNDFSSWCFRPIFCPSKWTKIVNVKTRRSPIYSENVFSSDVLDICFKKSLFFFFLKMFRHRIIWINQGMEQKKHFVFLTCSATSDLQNGMNQ